MAARWTSRAASSCSRPPRSAYLIEDGRIGAPVYGATLIGNGPDVLTKVTRIGHDMRLDEGIGTCSKAGQNVPVGVGLPTILVSEITVGGTRQPGPFMRRS